MSNNALAVILTVAIMSGMIVYYEIKARILKALEQSPRRIALAARRHQLVLDAIDAFRQHYRQILAAHQDLDRGIALGAAAALSLGQSRYAFRRALRRVRYDDIDEARYWIKRAEARLTLVTNT